MLLFLCAAILRKKRERNDKKKYFLFRKNRQKREIGAEGYLA